MIRATLCIAALATALPAAAQETDTGVYINEALMAEVSYGLNCDVEIVDSLEAPGTERGRIDLFETPPELSPLGQLVPALLGLGFGVRARAADGVRIEGATFQVMHPPFDGTGTTRQSWQANYSDRVLSTHLYRFDAPYEAMTGPWIMEATHAGALLFRIRFTVVPPEAYPGAKELCDPKGLLSLAPTPPGRAGPG